MTIIKSTHKRMMSKMCGCWSHGEYTCPILHFYIFMKCEVEVGMVSSTKISDIFIIRNDK